MKTGDVVRLKGGGPAMTVLYHVNEDDTRACEVTQFVRCLWFLADGSLRSSTFYAETLEPSGPDPWLGFPHYQVQTR